MIRGGPTDQGGRGEERGAVADPRILPMYVRTYSHMSREMPTSAYHMSPLHLLLARSRGGRSQGEMERGEKEGGGRA